MAYTVTRQKTAFGNKRIVLLKISADAATQTVETGLKRIDHINWCPNSMSTYGVKVAINSNASGVQSMGVLGCTGFTTGDVMFATVYGIG